MRDKTNTLSLFGSKLLIQKTEKKGRTTERLERLDLHGELQKKILPLCRLKYGEIWEDPISGHKVGVLDAKWNLTDWGIWFLKRVRKNEVVPSRTSYTSR
jgi:hypothetical protein